VLLSAIESCKEYKDILLGYHDQLLSLQFLSHGMFFLFGYDFASFYDIILMLRRFLCNTSKEIEHERFLSIFLCVNHFHLPSLEVRMIDVS
jgi:hypothetical protein